MLILSFLFGCLLMFGWQRLMQTKQQLDISDQTLLAETVPQQFGELDAIKNALLQSNLSAIVAIDEQDRILEFNPSAERLFKRTRSEVLGLLMAEVIIPVHYRQKHYAGLKRFLQTGRGMVMQQRIEVSALNADGVEFPIEMEITPVANGSGYIFVAVINDITERTQSTQKIKLALSEAEDANRAKSRFLTSVSHEIRTPLHAILGLIECLQHTALNDQQYQYIATAQTAGENLLNMVNDILDIGQIEAGKREAHFSICNPRQLIDEHVEIYRQRFTEKGLAMYLIEDIDLPRQLKTDITMLRQILSNLLSNACKYTQSGSVTVKSWTESATNEAQSGWWCCSVQDTGPGFTDEQLSALFGEFTRFHDESNTSGSGVGLMISRMLAEQLGGQLAVDSAAGQGACFTLKLPLAGSPKHRLRRQFLQLKALPVWLLSNDPHWLACLTAQLNSLGVQVQVVDEPALSHLPADAIVLVDIQPSQPAMLLSATAPSVAQSTKCFITAGADVSPEWLASPRHFAFVSQPYRQRDLIKALRAARRQHSLIWQPGRNQQPQLTVAPAQALQAFHVLLVDDSEVNRLTIKTFLGLEGIKVTEAVNGEDAIAKVKEHRFDLILMDVRMPVLGGLEATEYIRQHHLAEHTPVIALTAHVQENEKQRCLAAGMQDFLTKPIGKAMLVNRVMHWLTQHKPVPVEQQVVAVVGPWQDKPLVDLEPLMRLKNDLPAADFERLMAIFRREAVKQINEVHQFLLDGAYDRVEILVHALKSSAQTFGASRLSTLAKSIEMACREKNYQQVSQYCQLLTALNEQTQDAFNESYN